MHDAKFKDNIRLSNSVPNVSMATKFADPTGYGLYYFTMHIRNTNKKKKIKLIKNGRKENYCH